MGKPEANAVEILRQKYPNAKFYIEDTKSDPQAGLKAAQKLLEIDKVNVMYCDLSNVANAVVPLTEDHNAIFMATVYLSDFVTRGQYTIRNLPTGKYESQLLLSELARIRPTSTKIAAIVSNDEFGRSSLSDFKQALSETPNKLVYDGTFENDPAKMKSVAQVLISQNADAIYISSLSPALGTLIRNLREAQYSGQIMTTDAFALDYIRAAAGDAQRGVLYPKFMNTPKLQELDREYRKRFGEPIPTTATLCHEGLSLLLDAWKSSPRLAFSAFIKSLGNMEYDSAFGRLTVTGREIKYPMIPTIVE